MIKIQYRLKTGRKLNLKNPVRYTEKLQWYKLYYKDLSMAQCADKYNVREYIKSKGLKNILNVLYGVYDKINDIVFEELPNEFVLKKTSGVGGNDVIICTDKLSVNWAVATKKMREWTKETSNGGGREWIYYKVKPRIVVEKFIHAEDDDLVDYKFFCFNGNPYCLYVINGRKLGKDINLGIFDMNFNQLPYFRADENMMLSVSTKPKNFEKMIKIAKILSKDFPHVRVDLYNVDGKIIFGELTFFDGSGYQSYKPDEFDFLLGKEFVLPNKYV